MRKTIQMYAAAAFAAAGGLYSCGDHGSATRQSARAVPIRADIPDATFNVATATLSTSAAEQQAIKTPDFELRDWMAFGSGCRARASKPGDASLKVTEVTNRARRYAIRFELARYGIKVGDPALQTVASFARECGIRLAIYPAMGRRLSGVTAEPVYHLDKSAGLKVRLRSRLFVGESTLVRFEKWFEEADVVRDTQQPVLWETVTPSDSVFSRLKCDDPQMVGLDLSAATIRQDLKHDEVVIAMHQGEAVLTLDFALCEDTERWSAAASRFDSPALGASVP